MASDDAGSLELVQFAFFEAQEAAVDLTVVHAERGRAGRLRERFAVEQDREAGDSGVDVSVRSGVPHVEQCAALPEVRITQRLRGGPDRGARHAVLHQFSQDLLADQGLDALLNGVARGVDVGVARVEGLEPRVVVPVSAAKRGGEATPLLVAGDGDDCRCRLIR